MWWKGMQSVQPQLSRGLLLRQQVTGCCWRSLCSSSTSAQTKQQTGQIELLGKSYDTDTWTNVTPRVLSKLGKNLHSQKNNPLHLIRKRIEDYFHVNYRKNHSPLFAVVDQLSPVVTTHQNFDSLLVPKDHVSRERTDTYYVNSEHLLRAHTSAHQVELMKTGHGAFLCVGDVYRRDEIDSSHYPVFHQMEGVRLFYEHELFRNVKDPTGLSAFDNAKERRPEKQERHSMETAKLLEHDLKQALLGLTFKLFGKDVKYRWVECYFPFTHPSWELEIFHEGEWLEVLGCGIMEQAILDSASSKDQVGWAFGLGLERLAMKLYEIPDIRLFWSEHPAFAMQFDVTDPDTPIKFKNFSTYMPCQNDASFWIPDGFSPNDFYDLVRNVGGDLVESVTLIDNFVHPKTNRRSQCYRIVYRHMEKVFTQPEVNDIHNNIMDIATEELGIEVRKKT